MPSLKRIIRAGAACAATMLTLSGCVAQQGLRHYGWYGNHPGLYSLAFRAAATEAVIQRTYGESFYEYFGDTVYRQPTTGPCDRVRWDAWVNTKRAACALLVQQQEEDCVNAQGCARLTFDPDLVRHLGQETIIAALNDPCSVLTEPSKAGSRSDLPTRMGMSADENWTILRCDGPRINSSVVAVDMTAGILEIHFRNQ